MTTAAIYVRVSTAGQAEDGSSLGTQEAACRAYAAEHGYDMAAVYREVFTGTELWDRPQLTALRETVRARQVDAVITYAIDRLSRDPVHLGVILSEADHAGVAVAFVSEPLDDSPEGELIRFVRGYAAKIEHLKIVERNMRGKRARTAAGHLMPGSRPLYGYRWAPSADGRPKARYVADPATAPVVQRIFTLAAEGWTLRAIAKALNDDGVPTAGSARRWDFTLVGHVLRGEQYAGIAYGWRTRRLANSGHKEERLPESEWTPLPEGTIPALVSPETFATVRERLAHNKARASRNLGNPEGFLVRGAIRCASCGRPMATISKPGIYRCNTSNRGQHDCRPATQMLAGPVDAWVWERISATLTQPELVRSALEKQRTADPAGPDLAVIERQIAALGGKRDRLWRDLEDEDDDETRAHLRTRWKLLGDDLRQLEHDREAVLARQAAWQATQDQLRFVEQWLGLVQARLTGLSYADKRLAVEALAVQVWVKPARGRGLATDLSRLQMTAQIPLAEHAANCVNDVSMP
jgi:site-specific DNA recombinase